MATVVSPREASAEFLYNLARVVCSDLTRRVCGVGQALANERKQKEEAQRDGRKQQEAAQQAVADAAARVAHMKVQPLMLNHSLDHGHGHGHGDHGHGHDHGHVLGDGRGHVSVSDLVFVSGSVSVYVSVPVLVSVSAVTGSWSWSSKPPKEEVERQLAMDKQIVKRLQVSAADRGRRSVC
eukprot:712955-Rhodomonas_salina.3